MNCPSCQKEIPDGARFCQHCGASTDPAAARPTPAGRVGGAPTAPQGGGAAFPFPSSGAAATDPAAEQPVWQGRTSWKHFYWHWILWFTGGVILFYLNHLIGAKIQYSILFLIIVAALLALLLREAYHIYSLRYRLTTQRLFFERGLLSVTIDQTELVRVDDVRVQKNVIDRFVGTGSIRITSSDQTDKNAVIDGIDEPDRVCEEIRRHTRLVRAKQTLFVESI
ncbi:MAG: PH domain-containing protein [Phycisphaerae bacterium]|nr:PH domain-containing protein [Phycisphaerae bacterium]